MGRELLVVAVLATLALGLASTQPSEFPNPGGPPDIVGLWASPGEDGVGVSSCLVNGSEFSCSHLSEGLPIVQLGSFSSYECAGPGEYVGYLQRVVFDAQGNLLENETRCERGRVDQDTGSWNWASFIAPDCPESSDLVPGLVMVDSVLGNIGRELYCS